MSRAETESTLLQPLLQQQADSTIELSGAPADNDNANGNGPDGYIIADSRDDGQYPEKDEISFEENDRLEMAPQDMLHLCFLLFLIGYVMIHRDDSSSALIGLCASMFPTFMMVTIKSIHMALTDDNTSPPMEFTAVLAVVSARTVIIGVVALCNSFATIALFLLLEYYVVTGIGMGLTRVPLRSGDKSSQPLAPEEETLLERTGSVMVDLLFCETLLLLIRYGAHSHDLVVFAFVLVGSILPTIWLCTRSFHMVLPLFRSVGLVEKASDTFYLPTWWIMETLAAGHGK